jgi:DNA-binding SARP family transcriptional activator/tetratricopeptide (TPR) repeat protein
LPTRKAEGLLSYLALPLGRSHPRDKLASLLWGDLPEAQARASLRQTLFRLRRAIGDRDGPCLRLEADGVALDPITVAVDVVTFEQAVGTAVPEGFAEASALYQGDFLAGLAIGEPPFEDWLLTERERLRELALEALARLLAHQRAAGCPEVAVQTALQLAALEPLQESIHRTLMRLYVELGRRGPALRQYQHCVAVLRRELGVEPEAETKDLYLQILRSRPAASPRPPATVSASQTPIRSVLSVADTALIGRERESALLRALLEDVRHGGGAVVAIEGEAGIGKSRLLTELAADASRSGMQVLLGRCHESEQILPFGSWADALRAAGTLREDGALRELDPVWRAELARLFPELARPDLPVPSNDARRLFESVARLLDVAAAATPLVFLLEDVHWADDMSLRLLAFVGRRISARPVLIAVTAREEEVPDTPSFRRLLAELEQDGCVTRLSLAPLSYPDTLELMRALVHPAREVADIAALGARVWALSQGNPFVVTEVLRAVAERSTAELLPLVVPDRVRTLISRRLERLGEQSRKLAAVGAVIGREFTFALLRHAAAVGEHEAAAAVEELVRHQVLRHAGDHFHFLHERVREVVYDEILLPRRVLLHRAVAEAIEALPQDARETRAVALGFHYLRGEAWEKAVDYLGEASARAIERSAYGEAGECLEQAIAALERLPMDRQRMARAIDLRLDLARPTLYQLGHVTRAAAVLREAQALSQTLGDEARLGRTTAHLVFCLRSMGQKAEAIDAGQRALQIGRRLSDLEIEIAANTGLGQVFHDKGDYRQAVALFRRNVEVLVGGLALRPFRGGAPRSIHSRTCLVSSLAEVGEFAEAAVRADEAMRAAEALGHAHSLVVASVGLGHLLLRRGDWSRAVDVLEPALGLARTADVAVWFPRTASTLGAAYVRADRLSDARGLLGEALERTIARELVHQRSLIVAWLGEAAMAVGDLDDAKQRAEQALRLSRDNQERGHEAWALWLLAEVRSRTAPAEAGTSGGQYREALALARALDMQPLVAHCMLGLGTLGRVAGRSCEDRASLEAASTMFHDMGMEYWVARAHHALGRRR